MSKIARTFAAAVAVLAATTLRASPLPGFVLTARTEHFSFYSRDNRKVDARKSEQFLTRVSQLLGQPVSRRVEYFRLDSPEEIAAITGTYAQGLTFPSADRIYSTQEFHAHEIVHLVAGPMGRPGAFFQEGLAVALGNQGKWNGRSVDAIAKGHARRIKVIVASFDREDPQTAYPVAGSFVGSLIETHGSGKVAEFFRACDGANTEAAFNRVFGRTLEEAWEAWAERL